MVKQRFNWSLNLLMLPLATWVTVTGIIAELFDINDFVLHKYPGYVLAVALGVHFLLKLKPWLQGTRRLFSFPFRHAAMLQQSKTQTLPTSEGITRRNILVWLGSAVGGFIAGNFLAPTRFTSLPTDEDIGVVYHHWSKPGNVSLLSSAINWGTQPAIFKDYPESKKIALAKLVPRDGMSVEQAIGTRRSVREYAQRPLTQDEVNRLMYYTNGITDTRWGSGLRASPSSGALYPVEMYLFVHAVEGVPQGIYHYNVRDHALEQMQAGDFRKPIADAALGQEFFGEAGIVVALTGIFQRARFKYQDRTYRYVMLEAGHLGQNIYLMAMNLGLGACAVGAFWDDDVNRLLGVDGKQEAVLYLLTVGHKIT
ncbi:MAG: SagB/ThcOx family dehydrogenase [Chloroflexi bacterium]|nr:SagB/ThcOx family dehydrogenase [Chloroflexota bacterium]